MKPTANPAECRRASRVDISPGRETLRGDIMLPSDPSAFIGEMAIFGLLVVLCWRLIVWVRDTPVRPDPWEKDISPKLAEPSPDAGQPAASKEI